MSAHTNWRADGNCVLTGNAAFRRIECSSPSDAAHICRCVNAHAELVAVLQNIVAGYDSDGTFFRRDIIAARAALAKAGAA